ncbi:Fic family protein [Patescibacteria group bacterium]|nr:Fic family protein [Patescibacteria group bacterium]
MNDTIFTLRQRYLVNLVNQSEGLSRKEIQNGIRSIYPASKITIIRDLNILIKNRSIRKLGRARALKYFPVERNRVLRKFDIDRYFAIEPDQRKNILTRFDFGIFDNLKDLFFQSELDTLKKVCKSFSQKINRLQQDILKRELERFTIELSWKSSKLEGNTYTLLETESLINERRQAKGKTKEEAVMILNHKLAFEKILNNKDQFKELSVSKVNQLHNLLVKDLKISTGIRRQTVGITGTAYIPLDNEYQLKETLEKTLLIANKAKNVFEKALIVLCMISYIQPYSDGNKRVSRMLTNAVLISHDLYPLSYRSVDEDNFKKALILFYEQGSLFELKKIFIEQIRFANKTYFRLD